ncbi:phospholipase A [Oceanospirillum linum]|nr:phospholipase A [Oceanospirillum linum]SEF50461.1 phospholipase A1 [Oleiphilus messinensis]SMP03838.1 phospholipase A1 [Oceanospirillum linum]
MNVIGSLRALIGLLGLAVAGTSFSETRSTQDVQLVQSEQGTGLPSGEKSVPLAPDEQERLLMADKMENTAKALFNPPSALRKRAEREIKLADDPLVFLPYKANYFLPVSYYSGYQKSAGFRGAEYGPVEAQFQISLKFPIDTGLFTENDALMAAYTQQSYWQLYEQSAPFRETMYEPELIYGVSLNQSLLKELKLEGFTLGINHQSNGQGGDFSRSWNRLFAEVFFASGDWGIAFKRWFRIPEPASEDDNPDIKNYVGISELGMAYTKSSHVLTFRMRNHTDSDFSRGNMQFSWSFPLAGERYKGYLLMRTGYGDTLADYDKYTHRVGLGISINDIL